MNENVKILVQNILKDTEKERAFTELHKMFYDKIWNTIFFIIKNETDTNDLVSITFTKAFLGIKKFHKFISFEMWLKTIAINTALDFKRKNKNLEFHYLDDEENFLQLESGKTPEDILINDEISKKLIFVFLKLKKRAKQLLELRYLEDLSYSEIAKRLNIGEGSVKSELHRARKNFKKLYDSYNNVGININNTNVYDNWVIT